MIRHLVKIYACPEYVHVTGARCAGQGSTSKDDNDTTTLTQWSRKPHPTIQGKDMTWQISLAGQSLHSRGRVWWSGVMPIQDLCVLHCTVQSNQIVTRHLQIMSFLLNTFFYVTQP